MIALDSSVLVRYLTQDDPSQGASAARFLEEELTADRPGFVSVIVLCEVSWVLRRGYRFSRSQVQTALRALLGIRQLTFGDLAFVERAVSSNDQDIADFLIHELGRAAGCAETVTFDRRFARVQGVRLLGG